MQCGTPLRFQIYGTGEICIPSDKPIQGGHSYSAVKFQEFSRSFPGLFKIFSRSFPGLFKIFSRSFPGLFKTFSRSFPGLFKIFSRSFLESWSLFGVHPELHN